MSKTRLDRMVKDYLQSPEANRDYITAEEQCKATALAFAAAFIEWADKKPDGVEAILLNTGMTEFTQHMTREEGGE